MVSFVSRQPDMNEKTTFDALTRDIFQRRLIGIAEEMSASLRRASYSSIIWDMYDYSCAILSPDGEILAQAETIPAQLGILQVACREVVKVIPLETWEDGDAIICNDPYQGCTHTPDIVLFSPVIHDGKLVAIAATIAHHVDIGGKTPCTTAPDNTEVFGEGLIFPPLRLISKGVPNDDLFRMLAANVRHPQSSLGDLRAQIAGCRTAERRLKELAARYGTNLFLQLNDAVLAYGENYMTAALREREGVVVSATVQIEDEIASDEPITMVCRASVSDGCIQVDFSGTSDQRANALNCPYASTVSLASYAVKTAFAPDSPQNGGFMRPIHVIAPRGSVLNPKRPGAVGSRHYAAQAVAEVVLRALCRMPGVAGYAGSQISFPAVKAGGFDTRPERRNANGEAPYFIITDIMGGGSGATAQGDGLNAIDTHGGNCSILSAEIMETASPVRVLRTELVEGSGGKGAHEGGMALRREYELLCDGVNVNVYVQQMRDYARPWGEAGGAPGQAAGSHLNPGTDRETALPPKALALTPGKGAVIRLQSSGGGGWGNPADRAEGQSA